MPGDKNLKVGFKEVLKAISGGTARVVYIASDSSGSMLDTLAEALSGSSCEVIYIDTGKELGVFCGIDVGASCAASLKSL